MFKSRLQELCQRRSWELPKYTTVKDGPDHMPRFTASINVNGQVFETPAQCKSSKDAHNTVARIAFEYFSAPPPTQVHLPLPTTSDPPTVSSQFEGASSDVLPPIVTADVPRPEVQTDVPAPIVTHVVPRPDIQPVAPSPPVVPRPEVAVPLLPLSPLPSSLPTPPPGLLATKAADTKSSNSEVLQQNNRDTTPGSVVNKIALGSGDPNHIDSLHMYKNQLQQFAQKNSIGLPMYTTESQGPSHARRFRSSVSLNGKSYDKSEYFPTLKEAEQAAAKIACHALSVDIIQEDGILYKNLLQELAQKRGFLCPSYETVKSGMSHRPSFASAVKVAGHTYRGAEAKTKKQAEMNAAKAAYCGLTETGPAAECSSASSFTECDVADSVSQNILPSACAKKRQDETVGEADVLQPKRAKSSPENVNVNTRLPGPLKGNNNNNNNPQSDDSTTDPQLVNEQPVEKQLPLWSKTVVHPRKSSLPKPEHSAVLPFSDDQWIAYQVQQGPEKPAQM